MLTEKGSPEKPKRKERERPSAITYVLVAPTVKSIDNQLSELELLFPQLKDERFIAPKKETLPQDMEALLLLPDWSKITPGRDVTEYTKAIEMVINLIRRSGSRKIQNNLTPFELKSIKESEKMASLRQKLQKEQAGNLLTVPIQFSQYKGKSVLEVQEAMRANEERLGLLEALVMIGINKHLLRTPKDMWINCDGNIDGGKSGIFAPYISNSDGIIRIGVRNINCPHECFTTPSIKLM